MSDPHTVSFPVQPQDDRPLPIIVAERWGFSLQHHWVDDQWWYSPIDWIAGISSTSINAASEGWTNAQRTTDFSETPFSKRTLSYSASDGKTYQRDFVNDKGLYFIAQHLRTTKKRPALKAIKQFLAESGAFADMARRDPEGVAAQLEDYAHDREYRKLLAEGYTPAEARQWLRVQVQRIETRKIITGIWRRRGIRSGRDFADLTNRVSEIVHGKSATQRKREMGLPRHETPRNYEAAADQMLTIIAESTAGALHEWRDSLGKSELIEDVDDTRPIIDDSRGSVYRAFSKKPRRLPGGQKLPLEG